MRTYSVFGIYDDNGQSWGQEVEAEDPDDAVMKACKELIQSNGGSVIPSEILVVTVFEGLQVNLFDGAGHASDLGVKKFVEDEELCAEDE